MGKFLMMRVISTTDFDEVAECGLARPAPTRIGRSPCVKTRDTNRADASFFSSLESDPSRRQSSAH